MDRPVVGIMSPGDMGGAVGAALHRNGLEVATCLAGRSELSRLRAAESGFRDTASLDELVQSVDLLVSILVPSEAMSLVEQVAASMTRTSARPVFAECNAISPGTMARAAATIEAAGGTCIDAGIIGGPPTPAYNPRIYCSGPNVEPLLALNDFGLDIRRVGPEIGQASGLKMVYAASTKGTTALWTELLTAARALGLYDALLEEYGMSKAVARKEIMGGIPTMPHRSRRWVGEMEEIAATFAELGMTPKILEGAAEMYRLVGSTSLGDQSPRDPNPSLETILDTLSEQLKARV